ncbi:hypothetical protein Dimus_013938 [Dionaea muscipula]
MDLDDFRSILGDSGVDIWTLIETAITVASLDHGGEFKDRRDRLVGKLYAEVVPVCLNCDGGGRGRSEGVRSALVVHNGERERGSRRERERKDASPFTPEFGDGDAAEEGEERGAEETHAGYAGAGAGAGGDDDGEGDEERRILAIKEQLEDPNHSEESLEELLQSLADMDITFKALKETDIGRHVYLLRKHESNDIRRLAKQIVRKWKDIVDEWVERNKPGELPSSDFTGAEGDSPTRGVPKNQLYGHPHPQVPDFGYSPNPHSGFSGSPEPEVRQKTAPARREPPTKPVQAAPASYSAPPKPRERAIDPDRLASARKRLHENYQEAENARKQRTIQVMDIHDIPKPKQRNRGGFHGRH